MARYSNSAPDTQNQKPDALPLIPLQPTADMSTLQNARMAHRDAHRQPVTVADAVKQGLLVALQPSNLSTMKNQRASTPTIPAPTSAPSHTPVSHTPGPWHTGDAEWHAILGPKTRRYNNDGKLQLIGIALVATSDDEAEDLANARLISAAPALLQALQDLLAFSIAANGRLPAPRFRDEMIAGFGCNPESVTAFKQARAAIQSATL